MNIPIVYENNWLLVLNKPPGLLVIPAPRIILQGFIRGTPKNEQRTLTSILNEDLKKRGLTYRLHPCHRLDRETSGLIIFAKGKSIQKKMMDEFNQRRVKKTYLAFIQGLLKHNTGIIKNSIEGLPAITKYKIIETRKDFSVTKVMPLTGRTNQIRIHFKQIGHPIVGEARYAFRKDFKLKAKRLCLHAESLEFIHPQTGKLIKLTVDLPSDMRDFLAKH